MRKIILTMATAGAAIAFAAPASAQFYPAPNYVPAYQQGYGYQQILLHYYRGATLARIAVQ